MKKTVLLIDHPVGQRDDRASQRLAERGFELRWCCPGKGEALPDAHADFAAVLVYGGAESVNDVDEKPYLRVEIDWIERWLATGRPYFGICLGGQLLARALGAPVGRHPEGLQSMLGDFFRIRVAVQEFVGEHLVTYKQVRELEVIDVIPKSASGKILRRELRDR